MAIPFIPSNDVDEIIENADDELNDLSLCIENTYTRGVPTGERRRAVPLQFPLQIWNTCDLVISRIQLTQ